MPSEGKAYVHAALALYYAGRPITEDALEKIVRALGLEPDPVRIKMLVASLSQIDLESVLKQALLAAPAAAPAAVATTQPAAQSTTTQTVEEKKEEKKEEEVDLSSGLAGLFGF
ncbi:MAG: 50S ribosomal protein L12 [Acidilobaceae archaeon]